MKLCLRISLVLGLALSVATTACSSDEAAGQGPPGPVSFTADPASDGSGATVFLRSRAPAGERITFDVVARGAADIHGTALRVTYDAAALAFVSGEASGAFWSPDAVKLAKEGAPGQLAIAWTEKGSLGHDASGDTVLGTVTFDVKGRSAIPVTLLATRSTIVDRKGTKIAATFKGGTIPAR